MLNKKLAEMNENGTLPIFKNYLANISASPTKVKSLSDFAEDGWYEVTDVDGFEKYLVYHYDTGKKISVRYIFGKTPKIQEANPKGFFGEIADVISVFAYDSTLAVSKLNTEEGSAVKLIGYDTEGNLVEDEIPEGIVVDDALNTESDNAIANAPVATALNEKADTADLLDGTLIPNKALQAKSIEAVSTESGAVQDTPFIYQGTGTANGTSIADTSPVGKHLEKQGNSVVVNQLATNFRDAQTTYTNSNTTTIVPQNTGELINGHKVLVFFHVDEAIDENATLNGFTFMYFDTSYQGHNISTSILGNSRAVGMRYQILTISGVSNYLNTSVYNGTGYDIKLSKFKVIDLTQWFAGNIPQDLLDHPENFFRYYNGSLAYNAGSMENCTGRYLTCGGRNVWDEEWEVGAISGSGNLINDPTRIRSKNYSVCIPNTTLYGYVGSNQFSFILFYDKNHNFISYAYFKKGTVEVPSDARYFKLNPTSDYGTTYNNDITVSLYYTTGDSYDQYFPYEEPKVYDTGSEVLRSAGDAHDVKVPSGEITRNIIKPDLSVIGIDKFSYEDSNTSGHQGITGVYVRDDSIPSAILPKSPVNSTTKANLICNMFETVARNGNHSLFRAGADAVAIQAPTADDSHYYLLFVHIGSLTKQQMYDYVVASEIQWEAAEPTTEQGTPFAENIEINDYGTMGWDSEVPQGCKIFYPADYALFIDSLGEKFNWDADDIVSQAELTAVDNKIGAKLPECPTDTDGTYVLKATVADGVVTYTWVAE